MTGHAAHRRETNALSQDPTKLQQAASDPRESVWVNASAGSGKTTILTGRVMRLLLAGVKPERILCLTFTRAAAAEMSLRVANRLSNWAVCSGNELSISLGELQGRAPTDTEMTRARRLFAATLACPGGMRIRTLHGFGQEVLRRFPVESGLPPHFAVIEESEARALQDEALNGILREAATAPDTAFARAITLLIETLGEGGFRDIAATLLHDRARITKAIADRRGLGPLVTRLRSELNLEPGETVETLTRATFVPPLFDAAAMRAAGQSLLKGGVTCSNRGKAILDWLENPEQYVKNAKDYIACLLKKDGDLYKDYVDKKLRAAHPQLDDVLRHEARRMQILAERCEAAEIAAISEAALLLAETLAARYARAKNRQAALDYDDLVIEVLKLLRQPGIAPWILHKLDDGLDHLLVDEAQDTSRAQWDIVALLAEEFFAGAGAGNANRTLFVVGDEKQSIYSFQNADPDAFAEMHTYFRDKIAGVDKELGDIPLRVSFRSAPAVLRAVDAVFAAPAALAGVSAVPVEHDAFKKGKIFGRVEVWPLLPQPDDKAADAPWSPPLGYEVEHDPQAALAEQIAAKIRGWLENNAVLPGMDRPVRPGDIMILLRRRGRFADLMVRALKRGAMPVPVTGVDRMQLLRQLPVMDLLALIRFVLLPEDDLNLAALLRGPLLNVSEDALMALAAGREKISLWQSLKDKAAVAIATDAQAAGAEQSRHIKAAHDYLAAWLGKADFMTPFEMLARTLNETCPGSAVSGRRALWARLGPDALDPIEELLNAARAFGRRHAPSLQSFLHWLDAGDAEIKRELDRDEDESKAGQVRIMTVHASKGLEAPIVFLPDTANVPRVQDVSKLLWDEVEDLPFYLARKPDTGAMRRLWQAAREKQLQEYRRLLYVAMTRASHRLYIGGWELKKREADGEGCWHNLAREGLKESEAHATADDGVIAWEDVPQQTPAKEPMKHASAQQITLPGWARTAAPQEAAEARPLSPSKLAVAPAPATPDRAFARGRIIHRLLQSLPDVTDARRDDVAVRFLAQPAHGLDEKERAEITAEVLRIIRDANFAPLFGPGSRAEAPLAGTVNGRAIAGQVDRLIVRDAEVWIADYKTNRPPPVTPDAIPDAYRAQMEAYRGVLQQIYPERKIRCFLVWTYGPKVMELA